MVSVESMIAIVQIYINLSKNEQVNIKISNLADVKKLKQAYEIANNELKELKMIIIERNL